MAAQTPATSATLSALTGSAFTINGTNYETAADLTGMAVFLASSESDYVVAQTYNVDGGNWMS